MLDENNTKAFIVLKGGKIVLEKYFDNFTKDSLWYWASAGKSLTGFTVGIAQQEGLLNINDASSTYLGNGWTDLSPEKEDLITVRHQLTMTSGLDDAGINNDCTIDTCLQYVADAGTRWAYHNAAYTLLHKVIEEAVGKTVNQYILSKISSKTGMYGSFVTVDYDQVFFSTARSMARFGLLIQNKGKWNQAQILGDVNYFNQMIHPSNTINQSYGYLWWLNGQDKFMLPGTQFVFSGSLIPEAPAEMYCAEGKNGQIINVIPSQGLVILRMGDLPPGGGAISLDLNRKIWEKLNSVICNSTAVKEEHTDDNEIQIFPNPSKDGRFHIKSKNQGTSGSWKLYNSQGMFLENGNADLLNFQSYSKGVYLLQFQGKRSTKSIKILLQ